MKIVVEVFSTPGCARCAQSRRALKSVAEELDKERFVWRDVNILEEMDRAVELGVMSPPSLAIDGELVFPALPTPERLRAELSKRLKWT
ncbi:MAG: thioredoxin family protein [Betaproteobacteria bacterium]